MYIQKPQTILEVGTSNGYSAILMGEVAQPYNAHITTIEFFPERIALARKNIERIGLSKTITVQEGDAAQLLPQFVQDKRVFDFIFLDANKEEYALYFKNAVQMMSGGGIIVADNTLSHKHKLTDFFAAVKTETRADALELSLGTGLMVITIS